MADATITVTQGAGTSLKTDQEGGVHTPYHKEDAVQRAALLAAFGALATQASLILVGTRAYGAAVSRVSVGGTSAQSGAITAPAGEVLVHASTRCFIAAGANPTATTSDIPLEAGEKFHLRITTGHKIAVLRDSADGYLNIVPVA